MQADPIRDDGESSRQRAWRDILAVVAVVAFIFLIELAVRKLADLSLSPELRSLPALIAGAAAALWLTHRRGDAVAMLGFRKPRSWWRLLGAALAILVVFILGQNLFAIAGQQLDVPAPDFSRYDYLRGNWPLALATWLLLVATAAVPEELLYRGFLLGRLAEAFGGTSGATVAAIIGQGLIFGLTHFQWGFGGILMTSVMGLIWGVGYVIAGRNLWTVILAHSLAHLLLVIQLATAPVV